MNTFVKVEENFKGSYEWINLFVDLATEKCHVFSEKETGFEP